MLQNSTPIRCQVGHDAGPSPIQDSAGGAGASDAAVDLTIDSRFDATPGGGSCITWVDHTNDADVRLTWDLTIRMNPDRCTIIRAGSTVRWSGNFDVHPLEPFGGDVPNPIPNSVGADSGLPDGGAPTIVVAFPEAGTFGYNCENHPAIMSGAITVVP
jgi:plastocyanin